MRGAPTHIASTRVFRCWDCDAESRITSPEGHLDHGPVLFCPLCGSTRVEPVVGSASASMLWARALHAAPVH